MSSVSQEILELRLSVGKEIIEGNWKGLQFRMITPSVYPEVLEYLHKHFYNSTPLNKGLEYSKEFYDEYDKLYLECLPQNLSFYARDMMTGEVINLRMDSIYQVLGRGINCEKYSKIVGVRVIFIQDRALEEAFVSFRWKTTQMERMNKIMGTVNMNADIYGHYGITNYVNFSTACVDPRYGCQGLATHMYERALKFVKCFPNFRHVKSNLTHPYARKICHKFGFKELARVYSNDFKDVDGLPLLNGAGDDEFVAFMAREL